jgi:hypothetical protein
MVVLVRSDEGLDVSTPIANGPTELDIRKLDPSSTAPDR